ncbi:glycerophosphodiester phosphodiesterase family protein [Haloferula sp. BvORR071]|uniref:glycerophosphodiester phosphodiesterase family protein n=1 Tax=Haloferula sp. BvORR071 TaxID=1396141 RepID=UPI0006961D07|nr:glycerophosphodiester phosphodiesterase family protein [Haloferula sp. BvORR071]
MNPGGDSSTVALTFGSTAPGAISADQGIARILGRFHDANDPHVLVVAHRGGYLSERGEILPENSMPAIERSIAGGAEILEIDVRPTRDGHLVLMHDKTVTRTTTGRGAVASLSLTEIRALHLRDADGVATSLRVPTFAEVMLRAKGEVMVNLDKLDFTNPAVLGEAIRVLQDTDTLDHALFKGSAPASAVKEALSSRPEIIHYMPVFTDTTDKMVLSVMETLRPPAVELIFSKASTPMLGPEVLAKARQYGCRIWVNSLWPHLNGGHHDAMAIRGNPDLAWGWIIGKGAKIIQTDYPAELAAYLQRLGKQGQQG